MIVLVHLLPQRCLVCITTVSQEINSRENKVEDVPTLRICLCHLTEVTCFQRRPKMFFSDYLSWICRYSGCSYQTWLKIQIITWANIQVDPDPQYLAPSCSKCWVLGSSTHQPATETFCLHGAANQRKADRRELKGLRTQDKGSVLI